MKAFWMVAALVLAPVGAAAQARLEDPDANIVEELVVQAKSPGPAWWKVSDEDTTVWILGLGDDELPAGVTWDRRTFDKRLKGANSLIVASRVSLGAKVTDLPALLKVRSRLRSKTPVETVMPEALRVRFVAARERIGQPASRYANWTPLVAGQMLLGDTGRGRAKGVPVQQAILKAAKREKVKLVEPARYEAMPYVRAAMGSLTPQLQEQCLALALDDAEAPPGRAAAAARGWARSVVGEAGRGRLGRAVSRPLDPGPLWARSFRSSRSCAAIAPDGLGAIRPKPKPSSGRCCGRAVSKAGRGAARRPSARSSSTSCASRPRWWWNSTAASMQSAPSTTPGGTST